MKNTLITLVLFFSSMAANAACNSDSFKGTWEWFFSYTTATGMQWNSCSITINKKNELDANSGCVNSEGQEQLVRLFSSTVEKECNFIAEVWVSRSVYSIEDGQMDRNRFSAAGAGKIDGGNVFTFNAVRK